MLSHSFCVPASSVTAHTLLVLAGGFGTRLRVAVSEVPKPLAPVHGQPFLSYLIARWREQDVTRFVFLLHHQAQALEDFLESPRQHEMLDGCVVQTVTEAQPLGTGGAVANGVQQAGLTGPFLVANADTWLGTGIHETAAATAPAMAIVHVDSTERYGRVQLDPGTVSAFQEKQNSAGSGWINAGLYKLDADLFREWDARPFSLERDLLPGVAATGGMHAVPLETTFIDIGLPEDYFRFCRWIETGKPGLL